MGGMAAQIPVKNDPEANEAAFDKVRADKKREASQGHDGTWVAHPDLVPVAMEVFDAEMPRANQILAQRQSPKISAEDLLSPHTGSITEAGIRTNISVGIQYTAAWLAGRGAVPIHNLMEDAATAEISRTQIWQWIRHGADVEMTDGSNETMTSALYRRLYDEELESLKDQLGSDAFVSGRFPEAAKVFTEAATSADLPTFLTLPAYEILEN